MMDPRGWRESGVKVYSAAGQEQRCSLVFVGGNFIRKAISSGWRLELSAVNADL